MASSGLSAVIQGGAMRSIYCVGAVDALLDSRELTSSPNVFASSAGCVAGLGLYLSRGDGEYFRSYTTRLQEEISGDLFINQRRFKRVVDVEFLVDSMFKSAGLQGAWTPMCGVKFEVAVTTAQGTAQYYDLSAAKDLKQVRDLLIATMAIPLFYPVAARIGPEQFWDGGISDPLPLVRALETTQDEVVYCISNVPPGRIGRPASTMEGALLRTLGIRLPQGVTAQMLAHNSLGSATERIMREGSFAGRSVVSVFPSDVSKLGGRLNTQPSHLDELRALGRSDALAVLKEHFEQ